MQPTAVFGRAAGAPVVPDLEINLTRVDQRLQSVFTWLSGGPTPPDPAHFNLLVNNLGTGLNIVATTPVAAVGYFSAFDDANEDFTASALANLDHVPSLMLVHNRPGANFDVHATASATSIILTLTGIPDPGEFAIIDQAFIGATPLPFAPNPTITASLNGPTYYSIRDKSLGSTTVYTVFADFTFALDHVLTSGAIIDHVAAVGVYTSASNTIVAQLATVVIE